MSGGAKLRNKARRIWLQFVARPRPWQCFVMATLVAAFFYGFQWLFLHVPLLGNALMIWWPVKGIAVAVLLVARRRHWWWILPAFATGLLLSEQGDTPLQWVAVGVCNTLEVVCTAWVLPHFRTMDKWLAQPRVASRFTFMVVVFGPVAAALLSLTYHEPGAPRWINAVRWGGEDMLGTILFTPLLLALLSPELWSLFRAAALPRTLGLLALLGGSSWLVFHQNQLPLSFVLYPIILLLGTQLGLSGAVIGIDLLAIIATLASLQGMGPFGAPEGSQPITRLLVLQIYLTLAVAMTMPVSVARVRRLTTEAQLRRAWKRMADLASLDGLTGVANRRRFDTALDVEWARARRDRSPLALLMMDADHFKKFNDNYGHLAGDACLRAIAAAIAAVPKRATDLVARYGGEEFAVLLPQSDIAGAYVIAESVRRAVYDLAVPHLFNEEQRVTVSIGLASIVPTRASEPLELIAASDKALYEAKHQGRNQVQVAMEAITAGR